MMVCKGNEAAGRLLWIVLGLCAGLSLTAAAEAQDLGVPQTPNSPDSASTVSATSAPEPTNAKGVPEGDFFTLGDPLKPLGDSLASKGIYLKGFFESTLYANVSGGSQKTNVFYDEAFYGADFDLEKMLGLKGTVIHFSLNTRFGGLPQGVNNLSGSATGYLQGAGPSNETRLNELTIDQHLFDDKIRFVVGRTTLANYFATSELYCQFQVGTCSNIGPFTWSANSNSPFWPIAVWAGEVAFFPTPEAYIRVGASEDHPSQYAYGGFPWNGGWSTNGATGVFVPVEVGYQEDSHATPYAGHYDIGFSYDSSNFADARYNTNGGLLAVSGGTPASDGSTTSVYVQAQKIVWRPNPAKPQALSLFAAAQFSTSGRPLVQSYYQVGAVLHGTFPGRPNDLFGIDFQTNQFNPRSTGHVNDQIAAQGLFGNVSNSSQILEVNYTVELAPGLQVKPYTAYFFHPDQNLFNVTPNPKNTYAWAIGVQFAILLNDALGLPGYFRPN